MWFEIIDAIILIAGTLAGFYVIFTKNGQVNFRYFLQNYIGAALNVASPIINDLTTTADSVVKAFVTAFQGPGQGIIGSLTKPMGDAAAAGFAAVSATLTATKNVAPADWQANANAAMRDAFAFGLASFGASAAFEALFPEKLNVLNGLGPMLATMAGFEEVSSSWLKPLLNASIATPAKYDAQNRTRPMQLDAQAALNLYSRGLITAAACHQFLGYAGHPDADIGHMMDGAFRPVQPFVLAASLSDGTIDEATIRQALTFAGYRPVDQDLLIHAFEQRVLQPYRQAALGAAKTAFERGLTTQTQFHDDLNTLGIPNDAQTFVMIETGYRKLVELADLYRRGLDEAAQYGLEPLANYVTDLEAIGLSAADADAHFAIVSSKVQGKALQTEQRAEAAQARALLRQTTTALMAQYLDGTLPDGGVVLALVRLGYSAASSAAIYAAWQARKAGRQQLVYGVLLAPKAAQQLREQVAPVLENRAKNAINDAAALAVLKSLGIPLVNAQALVAKAGAVAEKKAATAPK